MFDVDFIFFVSLFELILFQKNPKKLGTIKVDYFLGYITKQCLHYHCYVTTMFHVVCLLSRYSP